MTLLILHLIFYFIHISILNQKCFKNNFLLQLYKLVNYEQNYNYLSRAKEYKLNGSKLLKPWQPTIRITKIIVGLNRLSVGWGKVVRNQQLTLKENVSHAKVEDTHNYLLTDTPTSAYKSTQDLASEAYLESFLVNALHFFVFKKL